MQDRSVYLSLEEEDLETGICILDRIGYTESDSTAHINFIFNRFLSRLSISSSPSLDKVNYSLPLIHSANCPARRYTQELDNTLTIPKRVKVISCAAIESEDGKILLTRKTEILSLFPKSWVFPGGKTNHRESPENCCIREAITQTGIQFKLSPGSVEYNKARVTVEPLFVYESLLPNDLDLGLPRAQYMTMFFRVKVPALSRDIALNIMPTEVDYAIWLSREEYNEIRNDYQGTVEGHLKNRKSVQISYNQLAGIAPNLIGEGIAEGHKIVLDLIFQ